ncbi:MAG: HlyD family efflux transporter periplasmic adaptor subunit [Candidatus Paceibacterota bacterium]
MSNLYTTIKTYIVNNKKKSIIFLIILLALGYYIYGKVTSTAGDTRYVTAKVEKGTIISSITGTGQVSDSSQIDIKPEASGNVTYIGAEIGEKVWKGQTLFNIDSKDARKSVRDAEISLASAKLSLEKLKLQNSEDNMNADLVKAYDDGFTSVSDAFLDLPSTITGIENILNQQNISDNTVRMSGQAAMNYRNDAEKLYYEVKNTFEENRINFRKLDRNSSKEKIESVIDETYETTKLLTDTIKSIKNLVDYLSEDTESPADFIASQNTLSGYTSNINNHLSSLLSIKTSIKNYKDAFPNADLDLQSSLLTIKQKENALADAREKLNDYSVRAPFDGIIASIPVNLGDSVSSGTIVSTIITTKKLALISLNEVDVAKIKLLQKATLTFDAISDLTISGEVVEIDAIGTVSQGVVTYNIKVSFDTQDSRVKSGMSVSAAIITDIKQDILIAPNGAVKIQNGLNYVEMFDMPLLPQTDGLIGSISKITPNKINVEVGISNDLQTEIISGIKEGDEIVTRTILPSTTKTTTSAFGSSSGSKSGGMGMPH